MNKKDVRVLFMGTPPIAKGCLEQLVEDGFNVVGAFTRQDKPVGRKQVMTPPPVKEYAMEKGIPVYQPQNLKGDVAKIIREINPQLIVVVAYGRILPEEVIAIPSLGCVNLHVSLLPKYRGAAPIQWSLINGEKETGVTVMYIDKGLDTGDIIDVLPIPIGEEETQEELFCHVEQQGKVFLAKICDKIIEGTAQRTPQNHEKATLAPPLTKEMANFSFDTDAIVLHNKIRGQNPWPGAQFICGEKRIKVLKARVSLAKGKPGEVLSTKPLVIGCKSKAIELVMVQPEGSKAMEGSAWSAGKRFNIGDMI
ncbi:MAG: methionyl-tRNA formyltransferase [Oscillospiraceae bacterium]